MAAPLALATTCRRRARVVRGGQPAHAFADLVHVGRGIRQPHGAGLGIGRIEGRAGHEHALFHAGLEQRAGRQVVLRLGPDEHAAFRRIGQDAAAEFGLQHVDHGLHTGAVLAPGAFHRVRIAAGVQVLRGDQLRDRRGAQIGGLLGDGAAADDFGRRHHPADAQRQRLGQAGQVNHRIGRRQPRAQRVDRLDRRGREAQLAVGIVLDHDHAAPRRQARQLRAPFLGQQRAAGVGVGRDGVDELGQGIGRRVRQQRFQRIDPHALGVHRHLLDARAGQAQRLQRRRIGRAIPQTTSPGSTNTRTSRSKACCEPVVTRMSSGFASIPRAPQSRAASRSAGAPSVAPYCRMPAPWAKTRCAACSMPAPSSSVGEG